MCTLQQMLESETEEEFFVYCSLMLCMTEKSVTERCMTEIVHDWNQFAWHSKETEGI